MRTCRHQKQLWFHCQRPAKGCLPQWPLHFGNVRVTNLIFSNGPQPTGYSRASWDAAQSLHPSPLLLGGSEARGAFSCTDLGAGAPPGERELHKNSKRKGASPKQCQIRGYLLHWDFSCHLKWRQRTKAPARIRGTHRRRCWILFHFRGRMFGHKKRVGRKRPQWGGERGGGGRDWKIKKMAGLSVGEDLLSPIIHSHYTGCLWTAPFQ